MVEYLRPNEDKLDAWREAQKAELARVEEELARLTAAIASGGDLPTLHQAVQDRKRRRVHLREQLAIPEGCTRLSQVDLRQLERDLRTHLEDWRGMPIRQVAQGRQIVRKLLLGRLIFTTKEYVTRRFYELTGQGTLGRLLAGLVFLKSVVAPTGFEPVFQP